MKSKSVMILLAGLLVLGLAAAATAGEFDWSLSGADKIQPGQTIPLSLSVAAKGALNVELPNPVFTVKTTYTILDGSGDPLSLNSFTRNSNGNTPSGNPKPDTLSGSATATLYLTAPATLTAGDYTVTITPTATQGMNLIPSSIVYSVTVPVQDVVQHYAPVVTINSPTGNFLYGMSIPVNVTVDDKGDEITAFSANVDGADVTLTINESGDYTGTLTGLAPGKHTLTVSAANVGGTTEASSDFTVYVSFGSFLPPLAGSNKQMKSGSTLPVKFTILGAGGALNGSVVHPEVLVDGSSKGVADCIVDPVTGPYFQLNVKLPTPAGPHSIGVYEVNMDPNPKTEGITVK